MVTLHLKRRAPYFYPTNLQHREKPDYIPLFLKGNEIIGIMSPEYPGIPPEYPDRCDREADYDTAWTAFEKRGIK